MERVAADTIASAFDQAMGGVPDDIDVVTATVVGPPGRALVRYADRDDDMLVVGTTHGNRLARPSIPRYCVARAQCPVLVVHPTRSHGMRAARG